MQQLCPQPDQLSRMMSGHLAPTAFEEIAAHVTVCDHCAERLKTLPQSSPLDEPRFVLALKRATQVTVELPPSLLKLPSRVVQMTSQRDGGNAWPVSGTIDGSTDSLETIVLRLLEPARQPEELGRLDEFAILQILGSGGMGIVLQAKDLALGRTVALKLMHPHLATQPELVTRFWYEARALAAVKSDHVVAVYRVASAKTRFGEIPYFSMEHLRGEPLDIRLSCGPLPPSTVLKWGIQLTQGIHAIHSADLIHRDIKPGNVWLEPHASLADGDSDTIRVKLLDLGLVHVVHQTTRLTHYGSVIGTPAYMSPEQSLGNQDCDARSDLFSLGTVLYEMLTGRPAFHGATSTAVQLSLMTVDPPAPHEINSQIPESISSFVMTLLQKSPNRRPINAQRVLEELRRLNDEITPRPEPLHGHQRTPDVLDPLANGPVSPNTSAPDTIRGSMWMKSRRSVYSAGLLLIVFVCGIAAWQFAAVIRVATPKGTLVIETDGDVALNVTKNGVTLFERTSARQLELEVGDYGVQIASPDKGVRLSAEKFTILRGRQKSIHVYREALEAEEHPPKLPNSRDTKSTRRFIQWALQHSTRFIPAVASADDFPIDKIPHLILFEADPAQNRALKDSDLEAFQDFPGVENGLGFRWAELTTTGLIKLGSYLQGKPIRSLGLVDMSIGLRWTREPGGLAEIHVGTFQNIKATDDELQYLKNLKSLKILNLRFNPQITDTGIDQILKLEHLEALHVDDTGISENGLKRLRNALPNATITPALPE